MPHRTTTHPSKRKSPTVSSPSLRRSPAHDAAQHHPIAHRSQRLSPHPFLPAGADSAPAAPGPPAGAVFAVSLFGRLVPESFAAFDLAFFTLFRVTAGEPWPEAVKLAGEDGMADWSVAAFSFPLT
jgi:hypothetical protein